MQCFYGALRVSYSDFFICIRGLVSNSCMSILEFNLGFNSQDKRQSNFIFRLHNFNIVIYTTFLKSKSILIMSIDTYFYKTQIYDIILL